MMREASLFGFEKSYMVIQFDSIWNNYMLSVL